MHRLSAMLSLPLAIGFMLLCRSSPNFSAAWSKGVLQPTGRFLCSLSARLPFPALELGAIVLAAWLAAALLRSLIDLARTRCVRRALLRFRGPSFAVIALMAGYAALWYPAYWTAPAERHSATTEQVLALCEVLIDRLNAADLTFSPAPVALRNAERAAEQILEWELPDGAVKLARYPEWMSALGVSGLYSPWTGEAIVSPRLSPAALPFTACHELMHLGGIADEGAANIAAWSACQAAGGEAAVSADLWALRYAMSTLAKADLDRWRDYVRRMSDSLKETFGSMNGFASPAGSSGPMDAVLATAGLGDAVCSYDALVGWLAIDIPVAD